MLGAYPGLSPRDVLGRELTYHEVVSLHQNVERQRWRRAAEAAAGVQAAQSCGPLGYSWAEALSQTPEEARERHAKMNNERMSARARAGRRR